MEGTQPVLVLAKCINSAHSEGALVGGEYYLLTEFLTVPPTALTGTLLRQTNVKAYQLADERLIPENFLDSPEGDMHALYHYIGPLDKKSLVYVGPNFRFELVVGVSKFSSALAFVDERKGDLRGNPKS